MSLCVVCCKVAKSVNIVPVLIRMCRGEERDCRDTENKLNKLNCKYWNYASVFFFSFLCEQAHFAFMSDDFWGSVRPQSDWPLHDCYYTLMRPPIWSLTPHCVITPTYVCVCVCTPLSLHLSPSFQTLFLLLYFISSYWFLREPPPLGLLLEDSDLLSVARNLLCSLKKKCGQKVEKTSC